MSYVPLYNLQCNNMLIFTAEFQWNSLGAFLTVWHFVKDEFSYTFAHKRCKHGKVHTVTMRRHWNDWLNCFVGKYWGISSSLARPLNVFFRSSNPECQPEGAECRAVQVRGTGLWLLIILFAAERWELRMICTPFVYRVFIADSHFTFHLHYEFWTKLFRIIGWHFKTN